MFRDLFRILVPAKAPRRVLVGRLRDEAALHQAARKLNDLGCGTYDLHSPYPVHGLESSMGLKTSPLAMFTLLGTLGGSLGFIGFILFAAKDYPMTHSGKGPIAFWAYIPAWAEVTWIIAGSLILILGLLLMGLPLFAHPLFRSKTFLNSHADGFSVSIELGGSDQETAKWKGELEGLGATDIEVVEGEAP